RRKARLAPERAAGAVDAPAGLAQYLRRGRVGNTEMRRQAERRAVHHRHPRLLQQIANKILVTRDGLAGGGLLADDAGTRGVHVKGTLGARTEKTRHAIEHIDDEVPPFLEAAVVDRDE